MDLTPEQWSAEYREIRAIPSTMETRPSRAFSKLLVEIPTLQPGARALDVGSGNGRHSVLLAEMGYEVTAVDFAGEAIAALKRLASEKGVASQISPSQCSIQEFLDNSNDLFDVVVDSYVSCHFVQADSFEGFWREIPAHVAPSGVIYTSQFLDSDQYYRQFANDGWSNGSVVSTDPLNGISKLLFAPDDLRAFFEGRFNLLASTDLSFSDRVAKGVYQRSIFAALLAASTT